MDLSVDIIIPCYNQGRFLAEAIDSALGQTHRPANVIVVDDGSDDDTPLVAQRYDGQIRYVRKWNAGLSAARNTGILEATAEFVLFLDADDYLLPDQLARHMAAACADPEASVFHGGCRSVDLAGRRLAQYEAQSLPEDAFHTLLEHNRFACHSVTVRRTAFGNAGLFDVRLAACEDWDIWIRLAAAGCRFAVVPGAVAAYRRYPTSMSMDVDRMWHSSLAVLRKSMQYHGECLRCRWAALRGVAHARKRALGTLKCMLHEYSARGEEWAGVAYATRAVLRYPFLAPMLLRDVAGYARRQCDRLPGRLGRTGRTHHGTQINAPYDSNG
jgi:glycosyltransferase involved in cell wall biosynthesis